MLRRGSTSKWKQVLGFDDGFESHVATVAPPTPPYSDDDDLVSELSLPLPPATRSHVEFPRLPRDITFTRTGRYDILVSPSSPAPSPNDIKPLPDPPPLFYMTSQQEINPDSSFILPKPDLILHKGPSKTSTIISFASFQNSGMSADITLCPLKSTFNTSHTTRPNTPNFSLPTPISHQRSLSLPSNTSNKTEKLTTTGGIFTTAKYAFHLTLPRTSVREKFEWRYSSGPFVRTMDGIRESGGLKLVRSITGETVAVYAGLGHSSRTKNPRRVVGMFRFLGERLGAEFDILAVMSMVVVVERGRRTVEAGRIAFGVR